MTRFPIERPRPDPRRYFGIPKVVPGQTNMICPTEMKLMSWDFMPNEMLRCTGCGRSISRKEATTLTHRGIKPCRCCGEDFDCGGNRVRCPNCIANCQQRIKMTYQHRKEDIQ